MSYSTRTARAWLALKFSAKFSFASGHHGPLHANRLGMTRYTPLFALVIAAGAIGCAAHVRVGNQVIGYSARQE